MSNFLLFHSCHFLTCAYANMTGIVSSTSELEMQKKNSGLVGGLSHAVDYETKMCLFVCISRANILR